MAKRHHAFLSPLDSRLRVPDVPTTKALLLQLLTKRPATTPPAALPNFSPEFYRSLANAGRLGMLHTTTVPYFRACWDLSRALRTLKIALVPFANWGEIDTWFGYASGGSIAISPLAPDPQNTCLHEIAHVQLGHTTTIAQQSARTNRAQESRLDECEAEATAWVCARTLTASVRSDHFRQVTNQSAFYLHQYSARVKDVLLSDYTIGRICATAQTIIDAGQALDRRTR